MRTSILYGIILALSLTSTSSTYAQCGQKIFFWSPKTNNPVRNIWSMNADGTNRVALFNDSYYRQALSVSDDGTKLAYSKRKNPGTGSTGDSLWICTADIDGTNEEMHYLLPNYATFEVRSIDFNSNHSKILFNTFNDGWPAQIRDGNLYVLDIATQGVTQLTFNTDTCKGEAHYSPDNMKITYTQNGTGWTAFPFPGRQMNSDGTGIINFTPLGGGNYHQFNYSPDGSLLVFSHFPLLSSPYTLYTVQPNGSNVQSLGYSSSFSELQPVFDPTSTKIAIIDNNILKMLDLTGTVLQTINPTLNSQFNNIHWVTVCCPGTNLPVVSATPQTSSICSGQSVALNASGSNFYTWSPATGLTTTTGSSTIATPSLTSTYILTGTDLRNCSDTAHANIIVTPYPVVSVNPQNPAICPGQSTILTANGANSYTWSPATGLSATTGATVTASPANTTTYTITGTTNSCSGTATVTVTVNPIPPAPTASNNGPLCAGSTLNLSATGNNVTYTWTGPNTFTSTSQNPQITSVTLAAVGTYSVTATQNNCTSVPGTTAVVVNPLPTVSVNPAIDTICSGQSTTLTASGANTYNWAPGTGLSSTSGATVIASPSNTTTYTITGTNSNGCSNTTTSAVMVNPLPVITVDPTPANICSGQSIVLTATGATNFSWGPATGLSNTTGSSVTASPSTTITYTISGTDNNGCIANTTKTVTVTPIPAVTASANSPLCEGDALQLSASSIPGASYSWNGPSGYTAAVQNPLLSNVILAVAGTYNVIATLNGCASLPSSVPVIINPLPIVVATPSAVTICEGNSVTAIATGATDYSWTPLNNINNATGSTVILNPIVNTTYIVKGTDDNNCSATATVNVTVNPSHNIIIPVTICIDSSFTYQGQVINVAGSYPYMYKTIHNCDSTVTLVVTVADTPDITFQLKENACVNETIHIDARPQHSGMNYTWTVAPSGSANNTTSAALSLSFNETGMKNITLTGSDGICSSVYHDSIFIHENPISEIKDHRNNICGGDTILLEAYYEDGYSYKWLPEVYFNNTSTATTAARIIQSELIIVEVTNKWGCISLDSTFINADLCCQIFLPSAFTPNNDGKNDVFRIVSNGYNELKTFSIFNRFGERVFETSDISKGWNGVYNNNLQDLGTYFYYVRYKCIDGKSRELKGDVTLIR